MTGTFPKFLVRSACLAATIHVLYSGFLTLVVEEAFPHRMLNVRAVEPEDFASQIQLIASFFDSLKGEDRPLIGFFGSSFTFGYPFPPKSSFTNETQARFPDYRVVNVSLLSNSLEGVHNLIQMASLNHCRFETLVIEIPVVNETAYMTSNPEQDWRRLFRPEDDSLKGARGSTYFGWFLRRPAGLRHLAVLFEELTLADVEIPLSLVQPYEGYFATQEKFRKVQGEYTAKIRATLEAARRISDRVVALPTPVFLAGNDRVRYDAAALREQIEVTEAACRAVPGVATIEMQERFLSDEKMFCNLTHLGLHGNRVFGEYVARELGAAADDNTVVAGGTKLDSLNR